MNKASTTEIVNVITVGIGSRMLERIKMKYLKNNADRNDVVMTPKHVAKALINHFKPEGKILEPCKGTGNFLKYLPENTQWCEISEGRDFMDFNEEVDWIITNPPFSKFRKFLQHSMKLADNVVFLATVNHIWLKARMRDIKEHGFEIKEIIPIDTPNTFPQSGFQVGWIHLNKNKTTR